MDQDTCSLLNEDKCNSNNKCTWYKYSIINDIYDKSVIRIGYTASKKVGNAVKRNRARRRLRETVKKQGMRNSNVMAIAPTATIANITGVSQSIEPTYQNLYVKSNLSGEFTVTNIPMVKTLKSLGLWDSVMINDLKYYDGSVKEISRIP